MPTEKFNKHSYLAQLLQDPNSFYEALGRGEAEDAMELLARAAAIDGVETLGGSAFREPQPYHEFAEPGGAKPLRYDAGL